LLFIIGLVKLLPLGIRLKPSKLFQLFLGLKEDSGLFIPNPITFLTGEVFLEL